MLVGQNQKQQLKSLERVENIILTNSKDSLKFFLSSIPDGSYKDILSRISKNEALDYNEYRVFLDSLDRRVKTDYLEVSGFINDNITQPNTKNDLVSEYAQIKFIQTYRLRDLGHLDEATLENENLIEYLDQFDKNDKKVKIQKAYTQIHHSVMSFIERDIKEGRDILEDALSIAIQENDIELEIACLYFLSDYLVLEGKVLEFIEISEKGLTLEKKLKTPSLYYSGNIQHALNGYIFKGGEDERIFELFNLLYDNPLYRADSYSLYAQYLSTTDKNSLSRKRVLEKFQVANTTQFSEKIIKEAEPLITPNGFNYVLAEAATLLENDGQLVEALRLQKKVVSLTREIYSKNLSKSLANFKIKEAIKIKESEIAYEKEKSSLYIIFIGLASLFMLVFLGLLVKTRKQAKALTSKNKIISETLEEKELLVKEVHHRVKNNFQIVSSLLELQSKDIEDEKALKLANDGKNRVKSMALIHQKLYQNETGKIDFKEYLHLLIKELNSVYASDKNIKTTISSENMLFDIDTAIPLGLIINELITNAYKYAFDSLKDNELNINLDTISDGVYKLTVSDNGRGLDKGINIDVVKTLGLRLVKRLVRQLQGDLTLENEKGTKFNIQFKDTATRELLF